MGGNQRPVTWGLTPIIRSPVNMGPALCLLVLCFVFMLPGITAAADFGNKTLEGEFPIAENSSGPPLCPVLSAPSCGSFHMFGGVGRALGSIALFHCQEGYQLLGHGKLRCLKKGDVLQWSHPAPRCKAIPQTSHKGFRLAVIISLVSCFIIITLFVSFTVCCVREQKLSLQEQEQGASARSGHRPGFCMEKEERCGDNGSLPNSDQRGPGFLSSDSVKDDIGFQNCGFQRWNESLQNTSQEDAWTRDDSSGQRSDSRPLVGRLVQS